MDKWRARFLEQRLDGLSDEPRSSRPRAVTDDDVERVITLTLETVPKDATHWSTRSMAQRSGLSHNTVSRIWRAFGLQPHRTEAFKLSSDPFFIEKVRDIGEGARYRGALSRPAGPGVGPVRGREVLDPGFGPNQAAVTHAPRTGGTARP